MGSETETEGWGKTRTVSGRVLGITDDTQGLWKDLDPGGPRSRHRGLRRAGEGHTCESGVDDWEGGSVEVPRDPGVLGGV